jgi:hypothetical protein
MKDCWAIPNPARARTGVENQVLMVKGEVGADDDTLDALGIDLSTVDRPQPRGESDLTVFETGADGPPGVFLRLLPVKD